MLIAREYVTIPTARGALRGTLHYDEEKAPRVRILISCPHPLLGGTADNPVIEAIARGVLGAGGACLVWEYREADEAEKSGEAREEFLRDDRVLQSSPHDVSDAEAALRWFSEIKLGDDLPRVHCAGYSYGAALSLMVARKGASLLAVSPPLRAVEPLRCREGIGNAVLIRAADDFAVAEGDVVRCEAEAGTRFRVSIVLPGADHFLLNQLDAIAAAACTWASQLCEG
jgi:alpha/beta superfamily hydrolase